MYVTIHRPRVHHAICILQLGKDRQSRSYANLTLIVHAAHQTSARTAQHHLVSYCSCYSSQPT